MCEDPDDDPDSSDSNSDSDDDGLKNDNTGGGGLPHRPIMPSDSLDSLDSNNESLSDDNLSSFRNNFLAEEPSITVTANSDQAKA